MALDQVVADLLTQMIVSDAKEGGTQTQIVGRNLTQGLGVVNTTLIQQHGGTADDAAQMAALRTAVQVPQGNG